MKHWAIPFAFIAAAALATGCNASATHSIPLPAQLSRPRPPSASPIAHIVVMIQENRTFNDFFATFPGADGATSGYERIHGKPVRIALRKVPLQSVRTLRHTYVGYHTAYDDGRMDGFNLVTYLATGKPEGRAPYEYVNPGDIAPYWTIATDYALGDHLFQTQGSGSFTAHQDLIRGDTRIDSSDSMIDYPTQEPWGCPAPYKTVTSLITTRLKYLTNAGPAPCTSDFPLGSSSYKTLQDLLDAKSVSWKYYTPSWRSSTGTMWNGFLVIASVFNDQKEWNAHISSPQTNIFNDVKSGKLPAMSWIVPDAEDSDHPGFGLDTGPAWIASVVDAIGKSKYWKSTAIVIVWDDWGGFYDPAKPPKLDTQGGPGFRVPMLVVSPYVPANEISHTVYGFGSILRFIEENFDLGSLGTTDATSKSIGNMFDFKMSPRPFESIPSDHSPEYFLHRKPSGLPVDTE